MKFVRRAMLASAVVAAAGWLGFVAAHAEEPKAPAKAAEMEFIVVQGKQEFQDAIGKHKGKIVLVDFWATWCGPCVEKLPHNAELVKKFGPKGLVVVAMSMDEPGELPAVKKRLTEAKLDGVVFMRDGVDEDSFAKLEAYEIGPLPHFQLYDRSTTLVKEFESGDPDKVFDSKDIDAAIQALFDKEKP